jgi:mono/diheme cytochrome c family protein
VNRLSLIVPLCVFAMMFRSPDGRSFSLALLACIALQTGCSRQERPTEFEPNLVHAMKYQISEQIPMDQASQDTTWAVTEAFGTPDEPKLPAIVTEDEELASLVSIERLVKASGPREAEGRGLFRKHCEICHGVTGNGRGPTAAHQMPYPRDYRMGIFKFKSTPRGVKPTRDDLTRTIAAGISGTAMKKIPELLEEDVQALVDYVIYLSWRGEMERIMIDDGVRELDLEEGERIINRDLGARIVADPKLEETLAAVNEETDADELLDYEAYSAFDQRLKNEPELKNRLETPAAEPDNEASEEKVAQLEADRESYEQYNDFAEELQSDAELESRLKDALSKTSGQELNDYELYVESRQYNDDYIVDIGESWLEAEDELLQVPDPPAGLPLADSFRDYQSLIKGDQATQLAASVARGQELFVGKIASCSKCHGEKGLGNGQTTDYDDWVKDWTTRVNLKPEDRDSLIPLLARGALPPVNAIPRDFQEGIFRGGSTSADLYRRITQGIDGTPMPAATFVEGEFERDDVWHLINFIRSIQTADADQESTDQEAGQPAA